MITPSADDFRALARSSPWRWTTLRFTARWLRDGAWTEPVRAWLRRPSALRVETADGELLQAVRGRPQRIGVLTQDGGCPVTLPWPSASGAQQPVFRSDGLVAERPSSWQVSYDAPMYQDYFWVAMLDPVELADGVDGETGARGAGLDVESVAEVDHAGRPTWEAVVHPSPDYEPRCSCCALLRSPNVDRRDAEGGGVMTVLDEYPDAYRVRLDVQTGVCVSTAALGGTGLRVRGHEVLIEAVDEPMADELFRRPRRWFPGR